MIDLFVWSDVFRPSFAQPAHDLDLAVDPASFGPKISGKGWTVEPKRALFPNFVNFRNSQISIERANFWVVTASAVTAASAIVVATEASVVPSIAVASTVSSTATIPPS
jgi:hypothetical protein